MVQRNLAEMNRGGRSGTSARVKRILYCTWDVEHSSIRTLVPSRPHLHSHDNQNVSSHVPIDVHL